MSDDTPVRQFQYLPNQLKFFRACDEVRHSAYIGGVGSGKTHVLALQALREAAVPSIGLLGAPTYRMLSDVTRAKFFELCPPEWLAQYRKSDNKVILTNGSEIFFRSFENPEALQGLSLDWTGGDEMGLVKRDVFRMLQSRVGRGKRYRPDGGRYAKNFLVGNPAGPTHWTYKYFVQLAFKQPQSYRLIQSTSYENLFLDKEYTNEMVISFGEDSLYYKRFVLGQFVAFEGAYWPNFSIKPYAHGGHVVEMEDIKKLLRPQSEAPWYFGKVLDFGYEHPWVMMWYVHDGQTIIFYDEYWKRHTLIREHCAAILEKEREHMSALGFPRKREAWTDHDAQDRSEIENCYGEVDGRQQFVGFTCKPAEKDVMPGILLIQTLINQGRLFITSRCEHARLEIPSYRAKPLEKTHKEEPIKEEDDTCDCIRMAAWMELRHTINFLKSPTERNKDYNTSRLHQHATGLEEEYGPQQLDMNNENLAKTF